MDKRNIYSKQAFAVCAVVSAFAFIASAMMFFGQGVGESLSEALDFTVFLEMFLCMVVFLLFKAYAAHEKNVIQILIGVMLGMRIAWDVYYTIDLIGTYHAVGIIMQALMLMIDAMLIVNHMAINSERHSAPRHVSSNKILLVAAMIVCIGTKMPYFFTDFKNYFLPDITASIGFVMMYMIIVIVEINTDEYKKGREALIAAGEWNNNTKAALKKEVFGD